MNNQEIDKGIKLDRVMELFLRAMKGEALSVQQLAYEYNVSTRSITRDINSLKNFLAEHMDILGYAELEYSSTNHCYTLKMDNFLSNKELLAIISKEIYHYSEIGSDCYSVIDNLWKLAGCIENKSIISISYYKMSRDLVTRRIKPVSIMFCEYYFYLIGYMCEGSNPNMPIYYRIDRITDITVHRDKYVLTKEQNVDEGMLRRKSQFMWPGPSRRIRFEFTGPSVQAVLDRIPTAKVVERQNGRSIIEAEVFGSGIKMFLLSQGSWVKVLAPAEFVQEMKEEIDKLRCMYCQ